MSRVQHLQPALNAMHQFLKVHGYSKWGSNFQLVGTDAIRMIQLQSSTETTQKSAKFTVNLGVLVPVLLDPERRDEQPSVVSAHWRMRIGELMPERTDYWWRASNEAEAASAAAQVVFALERFGLPALEQVATARALLNLWDSGVGPGLTERQRLRYLQELSERLAV